MASAQAPAALTDAVKERIQAAYRAWLAARGFKPRRGQREMIAAVARTIAGSGDRHLLIEAGTGTGKTAAYLLSAIPLAQSLGKTVVLGTATVALQEQVALRDLPDLKDNAGLEFDFALAKGRRRYVCVKRLEDAATQPIDNAGSLSMFGFEQASSGEHRALYANLRHKFASELWNGEIDGWPQGIDERAWAGISTDHRGCANRRCDYFKRCPFFNARRKLDDAEVIVANHDLVLADLALGGGAVLPEPDACIYIFDEAHHLPEKARNHNTLNLRIHGTLQWLDQCERTLEAMHVQFDRPAQLATLLAQVQGERGPLADRLVDLETLLRQLDFDGGRHEDTATHRFRLGEVPAALADVVAGAVPGLQTLVRALDKAHTLLQGAAEGDNAMAPSAQAEDWLGVIGPLQGRAEATLELFRDYSRKDSRRDTRQNPDEADGRAMFARWAIRSDTDFEIVSAPLQPGDILQQLLWSTCFAAVCTSATLTAMGRFDRFIEQAGLPREVVALQIASPFDYANIATLLVPRMRSDPRDADAHTAEVIDLLPGLLEESGSSLVLFTSWRQLNAVVERIEPALGEALQVQGEASKQAIIEAHRARIDAGKPSHIVGVASFSEGVDLPGDYCRQVIVVKLPFAVPDDPVAQATAEWVESAGRNAFMELTVPDATLKLVQACGRLIRHESDHGRIVLLDRRIVSRRYGMDMLDSLPAYRREIA